MYNVIIQKSYGFFAHSSSEEEMETIQNVQVTLCVNSQRCPGTLSYFSTHFQSFTELSTLHKWHWVKCLTALYRLCMSVRIQMSTCNYITRYGYYLWPLNLTNHQDEPDTYISLVILLRQFYKKKKTHLESYTIFYLLFGK